MAAKTVRTETSRRADSMQSRLEISHVVDALKRQGFEFTESLLEEVLEKQADLLVFEISEKFIAAMSGQISSGLSVKTVEAPDWIQVESLSKLRTLVGGRFQNLKKKWVEGGFPLREHKGDKGKGFKVTEKGWIKLSEWIMSQGFEARLTPDSPLSLFEVRRVHKT